MGSLNFDESIISKSQEVFRRVDGRTTEVSRTDIDARQKIINDVVFNVSGVPGLISWWDAADESTIVLNDTYNTVAVWQDKGPGTGNLTPRNDDFLNAPVMVENGLNGNKSILFRGTDLHVNAYLNPTDNPYSIFCVTKISEFSHSVARAFVLVSSGQPSYELSYKWFESHPNLFVCSATRWGRDAGDDSFATVSANSSEDRDSAVVLPYITNYISGKNGDLSLYHNGVLVGYDSVTHASDITTQLFVGGDDVAGRSFIGYINELIIVSGDLRNTAAQKSINEYLSAKWDIPLTSG